MADPSGGRHNYRLLVEYDGTRYAGFQVQPASRTVAGELTAAVRSFVGEPVLLIGAGRTDAGVHAEGQVVNFLARGRWEAREFREALNDRLPADVNVLEAAEVEVGFHSRSRALSRTYRYQISTRRDAFRKRFVWWVRSALDLDRLAAEAEVIAGQHDFAPFSDPEGEDAEIRVARAAWVLEGGLVVFRVTAERFAYRMVRRLVGTMVEVGLGRESPGLVAAFLAAGEPGAAAPFTAPPSGLFLETVGYGATTRRAD